MDVSASVSGEAKGGSFGDEGCSSLGEGLLSLEEGLFSEANAMLGLTSSGVCSLGMSGAVVFWGTKSKICLESNTKKKLKVILD